ncbi:MAG: hypothetical protein A2784_04125 [Candidatus Chisholmbacteria bacterium RIFCSPHIGHO2_01_FULL_48_12]|uniref:Polysaccharide biosynthesis protein C-terminal domain-containing protein n=1 Tax=Candidatus Chisholmbacteria bacterium RIFCSPHIGHO2_01_FULL_48_12 TaxID=1797589 RepID=A0A1G1VP32_9BACT|nr:MAG: hypothetical protein A2784_04125 [Candidatus Chisholmbacteria bacterium RIFCSPHIGHO2_01_FULL_48_12]
MTVLYNKLVKSLAVMLQWIGKVLGFDASYFARNSFWVSFKNAVGMMVGFCLSIAFARLASKTAYGQYTFIFSVMYLINFLSVPTFNFALSQSVAKGYDGALIQATKVSLGGSLLAGLVLLAVAGRYFFLGDPNLGYGFIWAAGFFPLLMGLKTYDHFLIGKGRFDRSAQYAALGSILTGAALILAMVTGKGVVMLIGAYLLVNGGLNLIFWYQAWRMRRNQRKDPEVIKYGLYLTVLGVTAMVVGRLGDVLLNHFRGAEVLATYSIATVIPRAIQNLMQNFVDVAKIKVADRNHSQLIKAMKKHGWKWVALGGITAIGLWIGLPIVIPLIYSNKYNDAVIYGQVASLALVLWPINTLVGTLVMLEKKTKIIALSNFLPSVPNLILYPVAIARFGIWGFVGVNLLSWIYMTPFNLWALRREKDI